MAAAGRRPRVSVIIPVLDDVKGISRLVAALREQTFPASDFEVLVVDNGSTEDVLAPVRIAGPPFVGLREPAPGSYAARNRALQVARAPVLAFTDGDCSPAPDWIENGLAALAAHPEAGLIAGHVRVVPADDRRRTWVERHEMAHGFPQERYVREQHYGATANVWTRREVLDRVGPFNDRLKSGGDREWGGRVHSAGYPVLYAPDVVVDHPARRTFAEIGAKARRVVGGLDDLKGDTRPVAMTPRRVPGHLAYITRKAVARRPVHRQAGASATDAWRMAAVDWWIEYARMRERLRLRKGGQARR
jgi:glycosyltransferase involved in cell wall biosynthesis